MSAVKKNKKKASGSHATASFAQLVSQAQLNALKPYINAQTQQVAEMLVHQQLQRVVKLVMDHIAQVQTRQLAVERLLGIDADKLSLVIADVTDEGLGYELKVGPAAEGDLVRVEVLSRSDAEGETFGEADRLQINALLKANVKGEVQTLKVLEEALVGMTAGDYKELTIAAEEAGTPGSVLGITLKRVSTQIKAPEAPKGETPNE